MKACKKILIVTLLLLSATAAWSQLTGPSTATTGQVVTYTYTSKTVYPTYSWAYGTGLANSISRSGTVYTLTVQWTTAQSTSVKFIDDNNVVLATKNVTISGASCAPATPNPSYTISNTCDSKDISLNTGPTGDDTWYWQTTSTGTSTSTVASPGLPYHVTTSGTYYIRAMSDIAGCWSISSLSINVTVPKSPVAPPAFSISANTCGTKVLTQGTCPTGSTCYWQGTSASGTSTAFPASTPYQATSSGIYYIRAYSSGCWGPAYGANVDGDPPPPPAFGYTFCEWDKITITSTVIPTGGTLKWYDSNDNLLTTANTYSPVLNVGNYNYHVKSVSSDGCVSQTYSMTSVAVQSNCDLRMNWMEVNSFDQNQAIVNSSRTYSNGYGEAQQYQDKDMVSGQIFATQPLRDFKNQPVASTLSAPINSTSFIYRHKFVTNGSQQKYGANDFDSSPLNPSPVSNGGIGTLGWYYSTSNTLEPTTPVTSYPYERTYTPEGPNPQTSTGTQAGDAYKMGSGHETKIETYKIMPGELANYFQSRQYIFPDVNPYGSQNLLANVSTSTASFFAAYGTGVSVSSVGNNILVSCTTSGSQSGVWPINGTISVVPGEVYTFRVKGYRATSNPAPPAVYLWVSGASGSTNYVWPGPLLPYGAANESWVSVSFKVPQGQTAIRLGLKSNTSPNNHSFYITGVELLKPNVPDPLGYKTISTNGDGKKVASFTDANGNVLAAAVVTSTTPGTPPTYTYDYWSYNYYNELGQLIGSVAPNGVNTTDPSQVSFVTTFKYDHLSRIIETNSPDLGRTRYVYDSDGRLRFSQSQEQYNITPPQTYQRFSYTNYDYLGRVVESGEYVMIPPNNYVFEPSTVTTPATKSVLSIVDNKIPYGLTAESISVNTYTGVARALDATRCQDHSYLFYDLPATDLPTGDSPHSIQSNLMGMISASKNAYSTTWFSYDEYGRIQWSKQSLPVLGYKTLDYTYNYFDKITRVGYQVGQPDAFYHHYEYDADQRLTNVYTTFTGTVDNANDIRATLRYSLHGPLKRVELLNGQQKIQGIDYVYSLNGLKAINSGDPAEDPGKDGFAGSINQAFPKDAFGETIQFFNSDYASKDFNPTPVSMPSIPDQYNGNFKAIAYNNSTDLAPGGVDKAKRVYAYQYDSRDQLLTANWSGVVNGALDVNEQAQRESISGYDKNGNIQGLTRNGKHGQNTANFSYAYEANTNRLDKINTSGSVTIDYTYNSIGQLIKQEDIAAGTAFNISYTLRGRVAEIRDKNNALVTTYAYDDAGDLACKTSYNAGTLVKSTYYVHDATGDVVAIYEQLAGSSLKCIEMPMYAGGRFAMYKPQSATFFYEVDDHQGNVRALIGSPRVDTFTATMETTASEEIPAGPFKYISATRQQYSFAATSGDRVAQLNSNNPAGPSIAIAVSPGDKIDISVWAYYVGGGTADTFGDDAMLPFIATAFGGAAGPGEAGKIYSRVMTGFPTGNSSGTVGVPFPSAFITAIVYDKNDVKITAGSGQVLTGQSGVKQQVVISTITIEQPGLIYVCLNNRSNSTNPVYFDDFKIVVNHSPVVFGADYYPFGLVMDGSDVTDESYRYGYQGQFSEKDPATGQNEFELRNYDPRIGRWLVPDPNGQFSSPYVAMGNAPMRFTDSNGGFCCDGGELVPLDDLAGGAQVALEGDMSNFAFANDWTYNASLGNINLGGVGIEGMGNGITAKTFEYYGAEHPPEIVPFMRTVYNEVEVEAHGYKYLLRRVPGGAAPVSAMPSPDLSVLLKVMMPSAEVLEDIQDVAGLLGVIPGLNMPMAAIETSAALARGDVMGATFAAAGFIPLVGPIGKLITQMHHVIPRQIIKEFGLKFLKGFKINGVRNLRELPFPFHSSHKQLNDYVRGKMDDIVALYGRNSPETLEAVHELQDHLNRHIDKALEAHSQGKLSRLNDYFRDLNNGIVH